VPNDEDDDDDDVSLALSNSHSKIYISESVYFFCEDPCIPVFQPNC
jgi:hypothetical protein